MCSSDLVKAEDVRMTDSSRHLSGGVAPVFLQTWLSSLLGSWVGGCLGSPLGRVGGWVGRRGGRADPTCGGPLSGANRGVEGRALRRGEGGWAERAAKWTWAGMGTCGGDARGWTRAADREEGAGEGRAGGQVCGRPWAKPG